MRPAGTPTQQTQRCRVGIWVGVPEAPDGDGCAGAVCEATGVAPLEEQRRHVGFIRPLHTIRIDKGSHPSHAVKCGEGAPPRRVHPRLAARGFVSGSGSRRVGGTGGECYVVAVLPMEDEVSELAEIFILETRDFESQIEAVLAAKGAAVIPCTSIADFPPRGDPRRRRATFVVDIEEAGDEGLAALRSCPCVVLTGMPSQLREVFAHARTAGWEALIKPYSPEELYFRLTRLWSDALVWEPEEPGRAAGPSDAMFTHAVRRLLGCRYVRLSHVEGTAVTTVAESGDLSGSALVDRVLHTAKAVAGLAGGTSPVTLRERLPSAEFEGTSRGGEVVALPLTLAMQPAACLFLVHGLEGAPFGAREYQRVAALAEIVGALRPGVDQADHKGIVSRLLAHVPSGIMVLDGEGKVFSLNRQGCAVLKFAEEEVIGRAACDLFGLRSEDALARAIRRGESAMRIEQKVKLPGGATMVLGVSTAPIEPDEEVGKGSILVFQDLTRVKRLEERVRRADQLASVGAMAAGMAHEIRNPLASVLTGVQILGSLLPGDPRAKRHTETIVQQITRVNRIVQDLLTLGRPAKPRIEPCSLDGPVSQAIQGLGTRAADRGVQVMLEIPQPVPVAMADEAQLQQVLLNLLLNAAEAMPKGGELTVRVVDRAEAGTVRIEVIDTGEGIPPENLSHVFTPFFSTKAQGSGLGLAICNRIISDHGGQMEISSTVGKGTTVTIELPAPGGPLRMEDLLGSAEKLPDNAAWDGSAHGLSL